MATYVRFRDAEKETNDLLQACNELAKEIEKLIQDYIEKGFAPERTQHQELDLADLYLRIQGATAKELTERGNLLKACEADAKSLKVSLIAIPESVRRDLEKEVAHVAELLGILKEKAKWHYPDLDNPSLSSARELEGRLTNVRAMIKAPVPYERTTRDKIERMRKEIEVHLEELSKPTPESIEAPGSEMSIDQVVFFVFSALRAKRNGQVKVEYAEVKTGDPSLQNREASL